MKKNKLEYKIEQKTEKNWFLNIHERYITYANCLQFTSILRKWLVLTRIVKDPIDLTVSMKANKIDNYQNILIKPLMKLHRHKLYIKGNKRKITYLDIFFFKEKMMNHSFKFLQNILVLFQTIVFISKFFTFSLCSTIYIQQSLRSRLPTWQWLHKITLKIH